MWSFKLKNGATAVERGAKGYCPRGGAARHCTERADTPYLGQLVLLFGPRTAMPSRCEQMYRMVLGCNSDDGGRRQQLKALRHGATHRCMQQACTPYLDLRVLGQGHENRCHTAARRPDQAVRAHLPRRGRTALLPAQHPPPIYEQRLFPCLLRVHVARVLSLACCACTSPTCS